MSIPRNHRCARDSAGTPDERRRGTCRRGARSAVCTAAAPDVPAAAAQSARHRGLRRARSRCSSPCSHRGSRRTRRARPLRHPLPAAGHAGAPARHRRPGPRRPVPDHVRGSGVAAGRRAGGAHRARHRRAARSGRGLLPQADARDLAVHRPAAGVPVPHPRRGARRHPGASASATPRSRSASRRFPGVIRVVRSDTPAPQVARLRRGGGRRRAPATCGCCRGTSCRTRPRAHRAGHRGDPGRDPG